MQNISAKSPASERLAALNLGGGSTVKIQPILDRYQGKNSPLWVVRYKGKDHVFEGDYVVSKLFTMDGSFLGEQQ